MVEDCAELGLGQDAFGAEEKMEHMDAAVEEVFTCMLRAVCVVTELECAEERICAAIRLHGDPAGECSVEVPVDAGDRLTDAMLGTEADWDDEMVQDSVGELCNMITGCLKRRLRVWPDGCRISVPRITRRPAGEATRLYGASVRRVYLLDEFRIAVTLSLCAAPPMAA